MLSARKLRREVSSSKGQKRNRNGAVVVLAAFFMVVAMAMVALSVDVGYLATLKSELKRSTDAAALAGAAVLVEGPEVAELGAFEYFVRNPIGGRNQANQSSWEENLAGLLTENRDAFEVQVGHWDPATKTFSPSSDGPSTIKVTAIHDNPPLFFGRVIHPTRVVRELVGDGYQNVLHTDITLRAESIARYQPRDIALVLDFSASMNDDSELRRIEEYGESSRAAVEENLLQIYGELQTLDSPPNGGNLQFEPQYLTLVGIPPTEPSLPQITVTFQSNDVYVTSTKDISNIVLEFSDGTQQRFEDMSDGTTTGTFRGSGANYNKRINKVWVKSGINDSGEGPGYGERFEDDYATIKQAFGLDDVPYPYASGSWDDFIGYVKTSSYINNAGYRKKYGWMTLINYWLERKPEHSQTADLWRVSSQPVTAVKDAVAVFMTYIQEVDTNDRLALVVYNSPSQTALVEHSLTEDFELIETTTDQRQAGHYDLYTNIGAGIEYARTELEANARGGAFKMVVLMTDGVANRPWGYAEEYALQQAQLVADKHWPIVTISLGNAADTGLMQAIADTTDGVHFNIPGGESVTDFEQQLLDVFRQIADHRPLVLVK